MKTHRIGLSSFIAVALLGAACAAGNSEEITPAANLREAIERARQAVANSPMKISISAVGFDLATGSGAEKYLQEISQIGGGAYFAASDSGQLTAAMAGAATGQTSTYGNMPQVTSPKNGEQVGPSTLVIGRAQPNSVVVIQTEVYDQLDGQFIKMVPGHRHAPKPDGSFELLIATPLVSFGEKRPLRYEIHVFTVTRDGDKSPHAIITVQQRSPTP